MNSNILQCPFLSLVFIDLTMHLYGSAVYLDGKQIPAWLRIFSIIA